MVAGESSGDRALGAVLAELRATRREPIGAWGIGGDALEAAGAYLSAHVRDVSGMGLVELASRGRSIGKSILDLLREATRNPPDVALLASWSFANARIGRWLRSRKIPVLWISPPEVWAWGAWRAPSLARSADRMIVTLPFEQAIWREAGADAHYVGHPSLDVVTESRDVLRARLGITGRAIALLPGSRPAEIDRLLEPFVAAASKTRGEAHVLIAPSLDETYRAKLRAHPGVRVHETQGAMALLPAFDVALVASGTASLECAIANVPPVVAYAMHPITYAIARTVVQTRHIALPNVLLARDGREAAFVEHVGTRIDPDALARSLEADPPRDACRLVRSALQAPLGPACVTSWAARVVQLMPVARSAR